MYDCHATALPMLSPNFVFIFLHIHCAMAGEQPTGPEQKGGGVQGQYVYWITQPHPRRPELGYKAPSEFSREQFGELIVKAHKECNITIVETACFQEPHASGEMHHNCLVRAGKQFRWKEPAERLRTEYKVCVDYATHIRTWAQGVIYGKVASEHKTQEHLDKHATQWAANGAPVRFEDVIPKKWLGANFQRKVTLSPLAVLDLCRKHEIRTETEAWALAATLEEKGDKALMAFLMDNDVGRTLAKVRKASSAKEEARRATMTRMQILEEYVATKACKCQQPGHCYFLLKDVVQKNGLDGVFQREVVASLQAGRMKMRVLCVLGSTNMAKSFLFRPLLSIYRAYTRPDGGSYQLEGLLGKEIIFLNDFEYDEDAKKWLAWQYFKNLLEGAPVNVARPKNVGENEDFTRDSPIFITAPQEISLWRGKRIDEYETNQMRTRVKYFQLHHPFQEHERSDVQPCGHCGARFYLEGREPGAGGAAASSGQAAGALLPLQVAVAGGGPAPSAAQVVADGPTAKKAKTGLEMLDALQRHGLSLLKR